MENSIVIGTFRRPRKLWPYVVLSVILALVSAFSMCIAIRNAKPVCERVESQMINYVPTNVCIYELGDHYTSNDYISVDK